ncbi:MAG TPA: transglutaminase family protein, partial [Pseudomonadales bacterium]|nr:transglutaminase family protein [Pseudomonadales bacterium]
EVIADIETINPFDFFLEEYAEHCPFEYPKALRHDLLPYLELETPGPLLQNLLDSIDRKKTRTIDFLVALNQRIWSLVKYTVRLEPGVQTPEETLEKALGSCRDSAWLLVQCLRHLGFAARFMSGYLVQLKADIEALDGPSGPAEDFTDLHAWCEVYLPGAGWVGLDPTSGLFAGEGHIPLSGTPFPESAAPITGAVDKCEVEFSYSNTVRRIYEDPRVTKPYSDEQWWAIDALGEQVDAELLANDVRLTQGGEPTFVGIDHLDAREWNHAADGPHKRARAYDLVQRLWAAFAPGGVLHYGQGKWYPGEELPRWALTVYWRTDGLPLWSDPTLIASNRADEGYTEFEAGQFAKTLCGHLGLPDRRAIPAYEDKLYYLWKESQQPNNLDTGKLNWKDGMERARLARVLEQGLDNPTGYVIPLKWDDWNQCWASSPWPFRRGNLCLVPGDSPLGFRLPLNSLPWVAKEEPHHEQSQFGELQPLPNPGVTAFGYVSEVEVVRTALCVEAREGCLHIFLPPLTHLESFVYLMNAIERTAHELRMPVILEGYEPPRDFRLKKLAVTPDPGVIEVNIHPSSSWKELKETVLRLYDEARLARLTTEKFMLDGRHTGTGGGNHVTLGGPTPFDSPLLRRPDVLASLLTYWQHHPSLSYLFSGMFIGPTSQAPRVDEGRDEQLYELEIALKSIFETKDPLPWMVDRILRNLLVDVTGNTHRSEFCIDKLYSPDSTTGRLGLLEFRGFEMPPHGRMSLVQMLLLRALVAWFWREPYRKPLVRWGTSLHDRFMLPHHVTEDLRDVVGDLQRAGYAFELDWFAPFIEFRYPRYGTVQVRDVQMILHQGIEPWHVLGEEVTGQGTARFVDSSVERVELKCTGLTDSRYVLACNGRRVPMRNTGRHGEYVGGIRYKAWNPFSALHPEIPATQTLVVDLIDTWNGCSVGGFTYHVAHPGGRAYDVFPVNAYEAESRRIGRFWDHGHTPGTFSPPPRWVDLGRFVPHADVPRPMTPPPEEPSNEYPYTLDLRKRPFWG